MEQTDVLPMGNFDVVSASTRRNSGLYWLLGNSCLKSHSSPRQLPGARLLSNKDRSFTPCAAMANKPAERWRSAPPSPIPLTNPLFIVAQMTGCGQTKFGGQYRRSRLRTIGLANTSRSPARSLRTAPRADDLPRTTTTTRRPPLTMPA